MGKSQKLFSEFPPVTKQAWENKINQDLKGAPYKKLITKTPEGIDIKPYYHKDDMEGIEYLNSLPGQFPYNRSTKIQLNDWEIRQDIVVHDIKLANKTAVDALNKAATSLGFIIPDELKLNAEKLDGLLDGIYYECIHINFITDNQAGIILEYLQKSLEEKKIPGDRLIGSVSSDPLGQLSVYGKLNTSTEREIEDLAKKVGNTSSVMPFLKTISINADHFHNAGASAVEEIAFALSQISDYISLLTEKGLSIDEIAPAFQINFATGSTYFMEIAKIRATRLLFAHLVKAWDPKADRSMRVYIHSTTSKWNQTIYDPYVNMLRGTTESMSAAIGGADSITVLPFGHSFRKPTVFSERIARNTQVILKEEAHLNKVVDPAGGSYYIESLTDSLANESWKLFLEVEEEGGYLKALEKGSIQERIKNTARKRDLKIALGREVLLGTNKYPDNNEKLHEDYNPQTHSSQKSATAENGIQCLENYRGAEAFEEMRMKAEKSGKDPVVFHLTYGNLNWRKARAGFSYGFFAAAGYRIIDNLGFKTVSEGMKAAAEAGADIIVLCSSDEEYPEIVPEAVKNNSRNSILVIAGYPKEHIDDLTDQGIKDYIHVKSNILETLKNFNSRLGIK